VPPKARVQRFGGHDYDDGSRAWMPLRNPRPGCTGRGNFPKIFHRFALRALREFLHFVHRMRADLIRSSRASEDKPDNASFAVY